MSSLVQIKKRKTSGNSRLFFVISKKNIPRAIDRNKIRRRIRIIMAPLLKNDGVLYTIIISKGAEKLLFSEIQGIIIQGDKNN